MSGQSDVVAASAIRSHHQQLRDGLRTSVADMEDEIRHGRPHDAARAALLAYLDVELLPHAAAEEVALYPAGDKGSTELLVRAMRDEHTNLIAHVNALRGVTDPLTALTVASAILALFESHLAKENDLLIPALVDDPSVSLTTLLGGMHELVGAS